MLARILLILACFILAVECQNTRLLKKYFSHLPSMPRKNELARRRGGISQKTTRAHDIIGFVPGDEPENGIVVRKYAKRDFIVGCETFNELIFEGGIYIDKTLLIKEFLEDKNRVFMINCPRRWGKTINLDMIKTFLSIPITKDNELEEDITKSDTYNLFLRRLVTDKFRRMRHLKGKFLIANHERIIDLYLGKYPVIHLRFYPTKTPTNFTECTLAFRYQLRRVFEDHFHVVNKWFFSFFDTRHNNDTKNNIADRFRKYVNHCFNTENLLVEEIEKSLYYLSKVLYGFFKKKVFILIDDYHEPWRQIFHDGVLSEEDKIKFLIFYTNFMDKTFKSNPYLEKGILTGTLPPPEELRLTALSEVEDCSMTTGKFMEYYCINQWELKKVYEQIQVFKEAYSKIDQFYKSYKVNNRNLVIYNIWSISAFFGDWGFRNDWVHTGKSDWLFSNSLKLLSFRRKFLGLLKGKRVPVKLPRIYFTWPEYEPIIRSLSQPYKFEEKSTDKLLMFLYITGYLTWAKNFNFRSNATTFFFKIPNGEVHDHLEQMIFKLRMALTEFKRMQIHREKRDRRIEAAKAWRRNQSRLETNQRFTQKQISGKWRNEGKLVPQSNRRFEGPKQYREKFKPQDNRFEKREQDGGFKRNEGTPKPRK